MNILCLDIGSKKIGVAIASTLVNQARPLGLLEVKEGWERQLLGVIKQWQIQAVVLGDPGDRPENTKVKIMLLQIEQIFAQFETLKYYRWPEDYSSQEARLEQENHPNQSIDAIAAMLVLQCFLDANASSL